MANADELKARLGLIGPPLEHFRGSLPLIPDHEMLRRIGQGSYGEVWLARNAVGTYRAIKVVYRERFKDGRPYEREFAGIQKYEPISRTNEGLVDVLQIGRNDAEDYFYYVMELADNASPAGGSSEPEPGEQHHATAIKDLESGVSHPVSYTSKTLAREIRSRGRLTVEECITLGLTLNLALGHLHRHGLIHRDVKPSNIIFVNSVPKLVDIGLVTDLAGAVSFVGTEGFIPPEGPNSPQADLYALGKVLYEAAMGKDRQEFPEPFTALGVDADSIALMELNEVLLKACAARPGERYQTAEEMNADLALLHSGKSVKSRHSLERRLKLMTRIGIAATAVVVLGALPYFLAIREARVAKTAARKESIQRQRADRAAHDAEEARRQAEADKAKALSEAAKSQQVAKFLEDMLHGVGPAVAKGRDTALLKEILDKTVERMGKDLAEQPEVELELRNTLAGVYEQLGLYQNLEELACENVQLARSRIGPENIPLASGLNRSAMASLRAGNLSQAENFAVEALLMRRKLLGNENEDVAVTLQILGAVLYNAGKLSEAEAVDREGLTLRLRLLGSEDQDVATMLSNLSLVLLRENKLQEAETCARDGVAINRKLLGSAHPWLASSINNLGLVLKNEGKFPEAEILYRESLAMSAAVNGTNHPTLLRTFLNLASVVAAQGRFEEAEALQRQGLDLAARLSARDDGALAASLDSLGFILQTQGKLAEPEALYRQAYGIRKRLAGDPDLRDPRFLFRLASLRKVQGNLVEAETLHRQALSLRQKTLGPNHNEVADSLDALGNILIQAGKLSEAETLLRQAIAIRKQRSGEDHPDIAPPLASLGRLLCLENKFSDAEPLLRQSLSVLQNVLPDSWRTFNNLSLVGASLLGQKKYADAEPPLLSGWEGMDKRQDKIPADSKAVLREALQHLVQLYEATDHPSQASDWKQKLAAFEKAHPALNLSDKAP